MAYNDNKYKFFTEHENTIGTTYNRAIQNKENHVLLDVVLPPVTIFWETLMK